MGCAAADGHHAQLQEIRTYYKFLSVDIDRYRLDAGYRRSCCRRELETAMLPPNAQTWVNLHVLFTHGNGLVMSPVTEKSPRACPPSFCRTFRPLPAAARPFANRASIGQGNQDYVIVKGSVPGSSITPRARTTPTWHTAGTTVSPSADCQRRSLFAWQPCRYQHPAHRLHHR